MVMVGEMLSGVIHRACICCVYGKGRVYVVVQFYPWFKFYFPLFHSHYHTSGLSLRAGVGDFPRLLRE